MTPARRPDSIAQRAYAIWEQEGRPHGRDQAHWDRAEQELASPAPAREEAPEPPAKKPVRARKAAVVADAPASADAPPKPARAKKAAVPAGEAPAPKRGRAKAPAS